MADDWKNGGFGLYVHWPFCEAKCPYCDFNSHVRAEIDQNAWLGAYLSELQRVGPLTSDRVLNSIFFGGGTPSLMSPATVHAVVEEACRHWTPANDMEVTLEANPGSVESGRFQGYGDAGVTRISMGVQALNDHDLRRLGRIHTVAEAQKAFDIARGCFANVSFDLIYARQDQSVSDWRDELDQALAMAVDHLSLYQLTIEQGTAFGDRYARGGLKGLPDDDLAAEMYEVTQDICDKHGYPAYEVSNHAVPGRECRHNLIYWSYGDYVGIGPGAHGRVTLEGQRFATEAARMPDTWLSDVGKGKGWSRVDRLLPSEQAQEYVLMAMRLPYGVEKQRFFELSGQYPASGAVAELVDLGMVTETPDRIAATPPGRMVLNAVIDKLLSE